jgi:hypothetical protein
MPTYYGTTNWIAQSHISLRTLASGLKERVQDYRRIGPASTPPFQQGDELGGFKVYPTPEIVIDDNGNSFCRVSAYSSNSGVTFRQRGAILKETLGLLFDCAGCEGQEHKIKYLAQTIFVKNAQPTTSIDLPTKGSWLPSYDIVFVQNAYGSSVSTNGWGLPPGTSSDSLLVQFSTINYGDISEVEATWESHVPSFIKNNYS